MLIFYSHSIEFGDLKFIKKSIDQNFKLLMPWLYPRINSFRILEGQTEIPVMFKA